MMSQFTTEQLAAGPKDRGEITHFTTEGGGLWHELGWDPALNWADGAFAFKFESGDIWDPIAGWRHESDHRT